MSEFGGLNIALSGLQVSQRGLQLAGQNVANANTDGYSRQALDLTSIAGPLAPALWSKWTGDGSGVQVADVARFRDQFLEVQAALEHGAQANLEVGSTTMQNIQSLFNEPTDTGMAQQLSDFWASWDDVANHPGDVPTRTQLLEKAQTLVTSFNNLSSSLSQQRTNITSELNATVTQINTTADQIASLNSAIKAATIAGTSVNDLLDKRDLLANQLAQQSGATIRSGDFNQVIVTLNGTALVQNATASHLSVDTSGSPAVVRWANTNTIANVTSGKAGGELNAINTTIPSYIANIDNVASTLATQVNALHRSITGNIAVGTQDFSSAGTMKFDLAVDGGAFTAVSVAGADWSVAGGAAAMQTALQNAVNTALGAGNATVTVTGGNGAALSVSIAGAGSHTLNVREDAASVGSFGRLLNTTGVGSDGVGGRAFFTGTTAATLAVSNDVAGNPAAVAVGSAGSGPLDSSRALDISDLKDSATGPDATYRQTIVQLGVDTNTAIGRSDIQTKATQNLDSQRNSYAGVNTDEEMVNMVQFQHAYEASARFLTTLDSLLDTLINHTGMTT